MCKSKSTGKICPWFYCCPIKVYVERQLIEKKWTEQYCKLKYWRCIRKKMQDKNQYHPDNMLPDGTINTQL
ncbi:MAG: uracil-DNA glycosylase [Candidatus Caldatribacteriota bacterium]|jgi:hypothetical protein|nr:uracil-DNA glycosylase [Atribacterota bacterium]MDD3031328.1 uracil-DNA glycosylase [Atribacterota bacterium]MDD3640641.1 uracil-DNA glycosylase [Atribacterota bacterium]MDD4288915.1 uracil-DNA glycosylase [Atribacterota bacterium]MDD4765129.1 uracil-DNA glycosylase [Atribacterota bacterium]